MKWHTADPILYGELKRNAAEHRRVMTEAESVFWSQVKESGLGQKCRRQYIIGPYIVDFFFRQSMLVVEIDGEYHFSPTQMQDDAVRQDWLEQQGYKVLRFSNDQVLFDTSRTLETVKNSLKTI